MDKPLEEHEVDTDLYEGQEYDEHTFDDNYRSVSKAAVGGFVFSLLGLAFLIAKMLIVLPVVALGLSMVGLSSLKRFPDELIGHKIARLGFGLSGAVLVSGIVWHTYVYMTEVPDGYQRISFRMLKDDKSTDLPYSEQAVDLDGEQVFLKGFVRPGNKRRNLRDFILVGDFGSCCFGGSPEITDVVAISIEGDERVNYGLRVRKIAGTFRLNERAAITSEKDVPRVYYQIDAQSVK